MPSDQAVPADGAPPPVALPLLTSSGDLPKWQMAKYGLKMLRVASPPPPIMQWPEGVPKHIHITLPDTQCTARPMNKYCVFTGGDPVGWLRKSWLTINPSFELTVHNDSACEASLAALDDGGAALATYRKISHGSIKADYWRIAYIMAHGGVYADADIEPVASLSSFVRPGDAFVTVGSKYPATINFHLMVARAGEPALIDALARMTKVVASTEYCHKDRKPEARNLPSPLDTGLLVLLATPM